MLAKKATDMYTGEVITYPRPKEGVDKKYDFHFKKSGKWYCIGGGDYVDDHTARWILNRYRCYRVVDALTGDIVRTHGVIKYRKCL